MPVCFLREGDEEGDSERAREGEREKGAGTVRHGDRDRDRMGGREERREGEIQSLVGRQTGENFRI